MKTAEIGLGIYSKNELGAGFSPAGKIPKLLKLTPPRPGRQGGAGAWRGLGREGHCKQGVGYL